MDVFPKFIIETNPELGGCLIIAKCTYHREIASNTSKVKGGGWFTFKDKTFTLRGKSEDFGAATIEDIKSCIERDCVFTDPYLVNNISKDFNFMYDTGSEIINLR